MIEKISDEVSRYSFGGIYKCGSAHNGRVLYAVTDSDGKYTGKLSIPEKDSDRFESSYKTLSETAPKIQKYANKHSKEDAIEKLRKRTKWTLTACGIAGAAVPLILLRNSRSVTKQILGIVGGVITGLFAGFGISIAATMPPEGLKFALASQTLSDIDIQPVNEPHDNIHQ